MGYGRPAAKFLGCWRIGPAHVPPSGLGWTVPAAPGRPGAPTAKERGRMESSELVLADLDRELGWIRETYTAVHRRPELSLAEHQTAGLVEEKLTAFGYAVTRCGGT